METGVEVRETNENGWRPMSTAPKDGTPVLIFAEGVVIEADWVSARQAGDSSGYWRPASLDVHGCGCCGGDNPTPQCWMPRPADPDLSVFTPDK